MFNCDRWRVDIHTLFASISKIKSITSLKLIINQPIYIHFQANLISKPSKCIIIPLDLHTIFSSQHKLKTLYLLTPYYTFTSLSSNHISSRFFIPSNPQNVHFSLPTPHNHILFAFTKIADSPKNTFQTPVPIKISK